MHRQPGLPAACSPLTRALLEGPDRPARVLGRFPTGCYLHVGDGHADVVPVLAADAAALPTGLRLAQPSTVLSWGVDAGDEVLVGSSRVQLPALTLHAVRDWRPGRVVVTGGRIGPGHRLVLGVLGDAVEDTWLAGRVVDLVRHAGAGAEADVRPGVAALLGRGRGLTPAGDDALCGVLLLLGAVDHPALPALRRAVKAATPRTTSLSASLLLAAADRYAVPCVTGLVAAAVAGDAARCTQLLVPVLALGHSSGRDLATGVAGAGQALLEASHRRRPLPGVRAS